MQTLFEQWRKYQQEDLIPGGLADNKPDTEFDLEQLKMGIKHELEHTNDKSKAKEIAKDHLSEDPEYYTKLKEVIKEALYQFLQEDSRGNIIKLLKFPGKIADYFHYQSPKYSFVLAKFFNSWWYTISAAKNKQTFTDWFKEFDSHKDIIIKHNFGGKEEQYNKWLYNDVFLMHIKKYMEEIGLILIKALDKNPNLASKLSKVEHSSDAYDLAKDELNKRSMKDVDKEDVLLTFKDGYFWYNTRRQQCDDEAKQMGHCGSDDRGDLVSLRDSKNNSHVTMTVNSEGGDSYNEEENKVVVYQIKGKGNVSPDKKYWFYIKTFFEKYDADLKDNEILTYEDESELCQYLGFCEGQTYWEPETENNF